MFAVLKVPAAYEIPDEDASKLRTVLRLKAGEGEAPPELPEAVIAEYYVMKKCLDTFGAMMTDYALATVVSLAASIECGPDEDAVALAEPPARTFLDVMREQEIQSGQLVVAKWRSKDTPGFLLGAATGSRIAVQINGSERLVPAEEVRLASPDEFTELPRNVNIKA